MSCQPHVQCQRLLVGPCGGLAGIHTFRQIFQEIRGEGQLGGPHKRSLDAEAVSCLDPEAGGGGVGDPHNAIAQASKAQRAQTSSRYGSVALPESKHCQVKSEYTAGKHRTKRLNRKRNRPTSRPSSHPSKAHPYDNDDNDAVTDWKDGWKSPYYYYL